MCVCVCVLLKVCNRDRGVFGSSVVFCFVLLSLSLAVAREILSSAPPPSSLPHSRRLPPCLHPLWCLLLLLLLPPCLCGELQRCEAFLRRRKDRREELPVLADSP